MKILTDFKMSPELRKQLQGPDLEITPARSVWQMLFQNSAYDAIVINSLINRVYLLMFVFMVLPCLKKPVIAVDMVLRNPRRLKHHLLLPLKRFLFGRVDHFIHYMNDLRGYERHYGITWERSSFVPFKVNTWKADLSAFTVAEDYIFTLGVSHRDIDTYLSVTAELPYPTVIPEFCFWNFEDRPRNFHWTPENLPKHITIVKDSGNSKDLLRNMARAKLVVLPTLKRSICASGVSTYLDAMNLGKCVIVSHGVGATELLTEGQAILVEPENRAALKAAITEAWENDDHRKLVAARGQRYAQTLGGEYELISRVMQKTREHFRCRVHTTPPLISGRG